MLDNHITQQQAELSYFYLNLLSYLYDFHPDRVNDSFFITQRGDEAAESYSEAIKSGFDHIRAGEMANAVLFQGLHFSPFSTIVELLYNEFSDPIPFDKVREQAKIFLPQCSKVFEKYNLHDDFSETVDYQNLYTELTGTIQTLLEDGI